MLKKLLTLFAVTLLLTGFLVPIFAQEENEEPTEAEQVEEQEEISIYKLLKDVKYVTKVKSKKKANVYFILRSHSKCPFCRMITPKMNEAYKEMKGKGAEIIMLNSDPDTETAKKWADETGIEIPMITPDTTGPIAAKVSAGGSGGFPNIMAVMEDGTQIEGTSGGKKCPELVARWKDFVKDARKAERDKAKEKKAKAKKKKKAKMKKAKAKKAALDD